MEPEMLEIVLQEILSEQKETNLVNAQLAAYTKSLSDKINDLDKRIGKMAGLTEPDHSKLLQQLQDHLDNIKSAIRAANGGVTHKKKFQLFPSLNIREYYQVYGNIFKWLALFGAACMVIRLIRDLLEKQGFL
jgi:hypothetical protein